ncbi:unnamed protein product [Lota lota]
MVCLCQGQRSRRVRGHGVTHLRTLREKVTTEMRQYALPPTDPSGVLFVPKDYIADLYQGLQENSPIRANSKPQALSWRPDKHYGTVSSVFQFNLAPPMSSLGPTCVCTESVWVILPTELISNSVPPRLLTLEHRRQSAASRGTGDRSRGETRHRASQQPIFVSSTLREEGRVVLDDHQASSPPPV